MKKPTNLSAEQIAKLNPKRLKAYKNKLLDYRRSLDNSDIEEIVWTKKQITEVQRIIRP